MLDNVPINEEKTGDNRRVVPQKDTEISMDRVNKQLELLKEMYQ